MRRVALAWRAVTVWINGNMVPDDEARISIFDHGLVVGDGVFETVKVARGVPFAMSRHLARLARSAAGLGLAEPDLQQIRAGAQAVIEASGRPELARMRITVTGGIAPLGSERGGSPLTSIVALGEMKPAAPTCDERVRGVRRAAADPAAVGGVPGRGDPGAGDRVVGSGGGGRAPLRAGCGGGSVP